MPEPAKSMPVHASDDWLTVCAISLLAGILGNVLHEGLGHAATALLTGAKSGVLSTVAWSSAQNSRLVSAGGTLANLAAALIFWIALRNARNALARLRFFLLKSLAFNLFDGTGYFLFSGFTDFGDWAAVIAGLPAHWLWRALLGVVGIQLLWQSALPATAGGHSGLLWLKYYIPKGTVPERSSDPIGRSYAWLLAAIALSIPFIFVLGRGITLHR